MTAGDFDIAVAIGGAAGQGIATPGNVLARLTARRGLHFHAYNAYQSIIRGGHILLTMRLADRPIHTHGDRIDLLVCLNQDTMDRHLDVPGPGGHILYNADTITPDHTPDGVELCGLPVAELTDNDRNRLVQNTVAVGAIAALLGFEFDNVEETLAQQFARKGEDVVRQNVAVARAGYTYAESRFAAVPTPAPRGPTPLAVWTGNAALAMGGAAAGVRFYCAYPMSPSTGVLHWMAQHARDLGIMVRQVEDEIGVANMAVGAAHAGCRTMCATSGGGFALMTEAIGSAGMMEIPVVFINVQRAGPSTGVPTKTEQGDLWQALGASQGDFERLIVAPRDALDAMNTIPELFNLCDRAQCPGIVLSDLLISEGTFTVDPAEIDLHPEIDRGQLIVEGRPGGDGYRRYLDTPDGVSPRAIPGLEGYVHVVATDEHDEDGVLVSDEFTNPHKRRQMVEKRARKMAAVRARIAEPVLEGPADADVTLLGFGSTWGVIREAAERLREEGVSVNHLHVKWLVPFPGEAVAAAVNGARCPIVVENNHSGQFYRYLRSETGVTITRHIRKYDGEPFMPHHLVEGVRELQTGGTEVYVPVQEVMV